jgi:hypothetical protein
MDSPVAPSTAGPANINIVLHLAGKAHDLEGQMAECGVYRGATLVPLAFRLRQWRSDKTLFGFDSFSGFDDSVSFDKAVGNREMIEEESRLFADTSERVVWDKLTLVRADKNVRLIKGYFQDSLSAFKAERFCFVHLDCDLYDSYRTCMAFFYPRMVPGGIILLDEYNDPVYAGCNKAVDEYMKDKPEGLQEITRGSSVKYYIVKE